MTTELNPRFTFDSLVIGANNRLAVTAGRAVAENPGTAHNPLFIYSGTGLGKTHLLVAIGHLAREFAPNARVEYLTLDDFIDAYHRAVSLGRIGDFRRSYGEAAVVLIDDVQFLARRPEEQAELLRFATQLQESGTQLVLTSDRPPAEIADLDDRLLESLAGGLVVDIAEPQFETRLAILKRRAEGRGVEVDRDVLSVVAEYDTRNVRELLGVLNRVIAFQAVSESALSPDAARALLEGGEPRAGAGEAGRAASAADVDEFGAFLHGVETALTEQVEAWQSHLRDAVRLWSAKGYRTSSLEAMLAGDEPVNTEQAVRQYEAAIERLQAAERVIKDFDPVLAENPVFRDPDRVAEAEALVERTKERFTAPPGPSEAFSIDEFLIGDATKMAIGAARSVIESPGEQYNPLVIVGPSGVGKTHLLHAIGRALEPAVEGRWVACVSAQSFMDELVNAIEEDHVPVWRARYRQASALLLDNIDLLASGDRVQDELFYLFNALTESGRQVVFTASVSPRDSAGLDDRLRSRLEGGLVTTLDAPDLELRKAILRRQLEARLDGVEPPLIEYLAQQPAESVRAVLGLGQRVITAAEAQGRRATVDLARAVLDASSARAARPPRARTAGVVIAPTGGIESQEKMVWRWPDPIEYVIEELG